MRTEELQRRRTRTPAGTTKKPRILVTRTDRLGDVLLALPALELIRVAMPEADIDFVAQPGPLDAIEPYLKSRSITAIPFSPANGNGSNGESSLKNARYSAALFLFAPPSLMFAGWRMGIPARVGNLSKAPSFLLLNRGVRQHRTELGGHEAFYNVELARELVTQLGRSTPSAIVDPIEIPVDPATAAVANEMLRQAGFEPGARFVVVHPGMGRSALNLSPPSFVALMDNIALSERAPLILTMGPAPDDQEMVTAIKKIRPELPVLSGMRVSVMREILRRAELVVAPSTGPLHLAHYVGTRTIGLYAPVRSMRHLRWSPSGGTGESTVLFPEVDCPGMRRCLGPSCRHFNCMETTPWSDQLAKRSLERQRAS